MTTRTKIILGIGVPLALFGAYWFIYRNREPYLDLEDTDWLDNLAVIKFGNNQKSVSLGGSGEMNAGSSYNKNKYKLKYNTYKNFMYFYVYENGNLVDKQTLDFGAKIRY